MEERTPIEVMLGMTKDKLVSAKKLYEFLELAPTQYARWCQRNILDSIAIEGEDYFPPQNRMVEVFRPMVENSDGRGRPSTDYLLTIDFAKSLCMTCNTEKSRQVREYFKKCEAALVVTTKEYNLLKDRVEQLGALVENKFKLLEETNQLAIATAARLESAEGGSTFAVDHDTQWIHDNYLRVKRLAEKRGMSISDCLTMLVDEMDESGQLDYSYAEMARDYKTHHPGQKAERLAVLAQDLDTQMAFEYILEGQMDYWDVFDEQEKRGRALLDEFADDMELEPMPTHEHYVDTEDPGFLAAMDALNEMHRKEEEREKCHNMESEF